jgi:flagellar hook-length control protein FliK
MEMNALELLGRTDQSNSTAARRSSDKQDTRFASLLDAQAARARTERAVPRQAEAGPRVETRDEPRADNSVRPDHAARTERAERAENRDENPNHRRGPSERASTAAHDATRRAAVEKAARDAAASDNADADMQDNADKPADALPVAADAAPEAPASDVAEPALPEPVAEIAIETEILADETPVAAETVPVVEAAPVLVPVAVPQLVAAPVVEPAETPAETETATAAAPKPAMPPLSASPAADAPKVEAAKTDEAPAAQIALPTSTLAEAAVEETTEAFADFVARNAAAVGVSAPVQGEAAKDALKAELDARDVQTNVTILPAANNAVAAPVAPVTAYAVQAVVSNDNAALDAAGAETAGAAADGKAVVAKPADPTGMPFAQSLEAARGAQGTDEPKAPRLAAPPAHEQVVVQIRKAVAEGVDRISIRLNPVELGRIDVKLDLAADGTLRASFAAERAGTLELLKNDSRQLERALSEAGLRADAGGLNFSLRGDNRENAHAFRDMGAQYARGRASADDTPTDTPAPVAAGMYRARAGAGRLDLNA